MISIKRFEPTSFLSYPPLFNAIFGSMKRSKMKHSFPHKQISRNLVKAVYLKSFFYSLDINITFFVSSSILWKEKTIIYSMLVFHSLLNYRSSENGVEKVLSEVFVALVETGERY